MPHSGPFSLLGGWPPLWQLPRFPPLPYWVLPPQIMDHSPPPPPAPFLGLGVAPGIKDYPLHPPSPCEGSPLFLWGRA